MGRDIAADRLRLTGGRRVGQAVVDLRGGIESVQRRSPSGMGESASGNATFA